MSPLDKLERVICSSCKSCDLNILGLWDKNILLIKCLDCGLFSQLSLNNSVFKMESEKNQTGIRLKDKLDFSGTGGLI